MEFEAVQQATQESLIHKYDTSSFKQVGVQWERLEEELIRKVHHTPPYAVASYTDIPCIPGKIPLSKPVYSWNPGSN